MRESEEIELSSFPAEETIKRSSKKVGVIQGTVGLFFGASFTDKMLQKFVMGTPMVYALLPAMVGLVAFQAALQWMLVHRARFEKKRQGAESLAAKVGLAVVSTFLSVALIAAVALLFIGIMAVASFLLVGSFAAGTFLQGLDAASASFDLYKEYQQYKKNLNQDLENLNQDLENLNQDLQNKGYKSEVYNASNIKKKLAEIEKQYKVYKAANSGLAETERARYNALLAIYKKHDKPFRQKSIRCARSWMRFGIGFIGTLVLAVAMIFAPGASMPALAGIGVGANAIGLALSADELHEDLAEAREKKANEAKTADTNTLVSKPVEESTVSDTQQHSRESTPGTQASDTPIHSIPQTSATGSKTGLAEPGIAFLASANSKHSNNASKAEDDDYVESQGQTMSLNSGRS